MAARVIVWIVVLSGVCAVAFATWVLTLPQAGRLPENGDIGYVVLIGGVALSWTFTGATLTRLRPGNTVGRLLLAIGASSSWQLGLAAYGGYGVAVAQPSWPLAPAAVFVACGLIAPTTFTLPTVLLAVYPDGHVPGPRWRLPVGTAVAGMALLTLTVPFDPGAYGEIVPDREPPLELPDEVLASSLGAGLLAVGLAAVVAAAGTLLRLRRAVAPLRPQLAWMVCVNAVFLTTLVYFETPVAGGVAYLVPVAVAVGVLRHRMFGIEAVLRRGLVYGVLTAAVFAAYLVTTAVVGSALHRRPLPGVLMAAVVAIALTPLRDRLQKAVDRLVYGARRDPFSAVTDLGEHVASKGASDLLPAALDTVARALRAPGAAVTSLDGHVLVSRGPEPVTDGPAVRLRVAGRDVATLTVAAREPYEPYGADDIRLLATLASQLAVIVRAVELSDALEQERDRILVATRAERDRIRRDLHDGLGPALSGIGLGLEALGDALDRQDAQGQHALLSRMRTEVAGTVGEIRRIIDATRPGALDGLDLVEALRRHADTVSTVVPVKVMVGELPPLPAEVETAVYRIVTEAVTNAVRHAGARHIWVTVLAVGESLRVAVVDDGRGSDAVESGVGLASMRRRAETLGGTFRITSVAYEGTTVTAALPLDAR